MGIFRRDFSLMHSWSSAWSRLCPMTTTASRITLSSPIGTGLAAALCDFCVHSWIRLRAQAAVCTRRPAAKQMGPPPPPRTQVVGPAYGNFSQRARCVCDATTADGYAIASEADKLIALPASSAKGQRSKEDVKLQVRFAAVCECLRD